MNLRDRIRSRTLCMSATEIERSLRAFDRIQKQRDLAEPGRNNCRRVLGTHNRYRSAKRWRSVTA